MLLRHGMELADWLAIACFGSLWAQVTGTTADTCFAMHIIIPQLYHLYCTKFALIASFSLRQVRQSPFREPAEILTFFLLKLGNKYSTLWANSVSLLHSLFYISSSLTRLANVLNIAIKCFSKWMCILWWEWGSF